jgi:hypothetical protein
VRRHSFKPDNSDLTFAEMTAADRAALAAYPQLVGLIELCGTGWFFQPVRVEGRLELLTGARVWPGGWSDATDRGALRFAGVVWRCGLAVEMAGVDGCCEVG